MLHRKSTAVLFLTFFLLFSLGASARTYYVSSSTGNDSNSGTDPSSPWRSLNKLNSFHNLQPGDYVLFQRGDTFYGSITVSNSGTSGSPITYGAYGSGEKPVITGFTTVNSWTNLGGNIWESTNSVSSLSSCNIVLVNSVNTAMGRWPNTGYVTYQSHNSGTSLTSSSLTTNWTGANVAMKRERWYIEVDKITSQSGTTINFTNEGRYQLKDNWGFFIENDAKTLDIQNEWYYNPSTRKIRIYSSSQPNNVKIATVEKTFQNPLNCPYITVDNLAFTGANNTLIDMHYSKYTTVKNCDLFYSGQMGIKVDGPAPTISGNTLDNIGYTGMQLDQSCIGATITNNKISNVYPIAGTAVEGGGSAIYSTAANTTISGNVVDRSGWGGISFYGDNSIVKNNFVNNSCLLRDDCAGISTHGGFTGQQIIGNIVLNSRGNSDGTNAVPTLLLAHGIFLDDLSNQVTVTGNSVMGCAGVGIDLHRVTNVKVTGNTCFDNGTKNNWMKGAIMFQCDANNPPAFQGIVLNNNIFFAKTTDQLALFYYYTTSTTAIKQFGTTDYNYYIQPFDSSNAIILNKDSYSVKGWQSFLGQESHSKGSPKDITNANDLKFVYNASSQSRTIALDASYIDVKGNKFDGSISLSPYSSAVLIKSGASSSLLPAVYPANAVNGLDYKYYEASSYDNLPDFTEVTPVKSGTATDFDISSANRSNSYSFNFTGFIDVPTDGQYTFYTSSDDGSQLFIDNVPVVDNDGLHGTVEKSGSIGLKAGKHAITVGFFQQSGDNVLSVDYSGPGVSKQAIPKSSLYRVAASSNLHPAVNPANTINGLNYKYYEASSYTELPDFNSGSPVKTGISHDFDISSANRNDRFSFNFTGYIDVPEDGQYTFYTSSDDGSNLYIDNVLVVDNDGLHSATEKSGSIGLKAGKHSISVGFFEQDGDNTLSVSYAGPGINKQVIPSNVLYKVANYLPAVNPSNTVGGLNYSYYEASYYNSLPNFNSFTPVKTGSSNTFDLSVAKRSTSYSLNYTGYIDIPADGQYTFYTTSDDGSNLYVDNILVVDNDGLHSALEKSGIIELKAGKHAISVGFFQQTGDDVLSVSYESADIAKQSIPASSFYRNSSAALGEQTMINTSTGMMFENDSTNFQMGRLLNHETTPGVKVYPNPFKNSIQIDVNGGAASKFKLALTDASGRIVWTKDVENYNSSYHESVNTSTLPIGVYFLSLIRDNKSSVTKLVKEY